MRQRFFSNNKNAFPERQVLKARNSRLSKFTRLLEKDYGNAKKFLEEASLEEKEAVLAQLVEEDQQCIINTICEFSVDVSIQEQAYKEGKEPLPEEKANSKLNTLHYQQTTNKVPFDSFLPVVWNVAGKNQYFVGRENALEKLAESLKRESRCVITQVITGLGGIGKTQLAREYAHRYKQNYKLIWWLRGNALVQDYLALVQEINNENKKLGLSNTIYIEKAEDVCKSVQKILRTLSGWLLIFDDVENEADVNDYIPQLHIQGTGHVLITSRNQDWQQSKPLALRVLPRQDAITLLQKIIKNDSIPFPEKEAETLADQLGDLPLALSQAAFYIRKTHISLIEYIKLFEYEKTRQMLWQKEKPPHDYPVTVAVTLKLSLMKLEERQKTAAIKLLQFSAFLASTQMLKVWFLKLFDDDLLMLNEAVSDLIDFSLIDVKDVFISIHTLVQVVVRDEIHLNRSKGADLLKQLLKLFSSEFWVSQEDPQFVAKSYQLIPHLEALIKEAEAHNIINEEMIDVISQLGNLSYYVGKLTQARRYLESGIGMGRSFYQFTFPTTVSAAIVNLSRVCGELSDLKAMSLYVEEIVTGDRHAEYRKNPTALASLCDHLGIRLRDSEPKKALDYHKLSFTIRLKTESPLSVPIATSYNNIGYVYKILCQPGLAYKYFQKALDIIEKLDTDPSNQKSHPFLAKTYNNLGLVCTDLNRKEDALKWFKKAISSYQKIYTNDEHPDIADAFNNIGCIYSEQGNHTDAIINIHKAIAIEKQLYSKYHPAIARDLNNLGYSYLAAGNLEDAIKYLEESNEIWEKLLKDDSYSENREYASTLHNLGRAYCEKCDERGFIYLDKALKIRRSLFPEGHPDVFTSLYDISWHYHKFGDYLQARDYIKQALTVYNKGLLNKPELICNDPELINELQKLNKILEILLDRESKNINQMLSATKKLNIENEGAKNQKEDILNELTRITGENWSCNTDGTKFWLKKKDRASMNEIISQISNRNIGKITKNKAGTTIFIENANLASLQAIPITRNSSIYKEKK